VKAKGITAGQTLVVVQDVVVNDLAELGSSSSASGPANKTTDDSTGDAANYAADRASDHSSHCADFSPTKNTDCNACGTGHSADGATRFLGEILGLDAVAVTFRAVYCH